MKEYSISLEAEIDSKLYKSLCKYLDCHPYWDLNRTINASLSLFMMQNWSSEKGRKKEDYDICSRTYLDSIFQEYCTRSRYEHKK